MSPSDATGRSAFAAASRASASASGCEKVFAVDHHMADADAPSTAIASSAREERQIDATRHVAVGHKIRCSR
jgi:hypothetical protein